MLNSMLNATGSLLTLCCRLCHASLHCRRCACLQPKQQRASAAGGGAAAAELSSQLQALRQQLEAEQAARAAAEVRVEFLKGKVRDVAERSKQRGNMLAQLALAARRVADAKQQLQAAEDEMQQVLVAAEEYLQVRLHDRPIDCRHLHWESVLSHRCAAGDVRSKCCVKAMHDEPCDKGRVLPVGMPWFPCCANAKPVSFLHL